MVRSKVRRKTKRQDSPKSQKQASFNKKVVDNCSATTQSLSKMKSSLSLHISFCRIVETACRFQWGWRVNGSKWSVKYTFKKTRHKGNIRDIVPVMEWYRINFKRDFHLLRAERNNRSQVKFEKERANSWRPISKTNRMKWCHFLEAAIERWLSFPWR